MAYERADIMPSNLIQNIITTYPNFSDPTAVSKLSQFIDLCVERIRSCKEMSENEMDALCYVFCSISNYEAFDNLVQALLENWANIGMTSDVYGLFVESNKNLITSEGNRRMYLYGLHPNTPNLVNLVMRLSRSGLDLPVDAEFAPDVAAEMAPGPEITEEEKQIFNFLDKQLWNSPVTSPHNLLFLGDNPSFLKTFLDNKRHVGNQKTDYICRIFNNLLEGEQNFSFENLEEYTKCLVTFMEILVKAIDPQSFQSQETVLVEQFISYRPLTLLEWLEKVVTSQELKQQLQKTICEIYKELELEAPDFSGEAFVLGVDSVMTEAGLPLGNFELPGLVEFFGKFGYSQEDVMAMEPDVMGAILLSLSANFAEQSKDYVEEPKPTFGLPFITRQWHDARFIDEYLLNFRDALANKECGLMPSITDRETLDSDYISQVVRGETGILRAKNINEDAEENEDCFSEDPPRKFQQLLWPTCTGQSHFGLLMLNFDEQGRLEGGFYFEPKKDFGRQDLSTVLKTMGDKHIIQLNMGQMDDDFCGDYVIAVIVWFTQCLNPRIVEWSKVEEINQVVLDKISNDPYYAKLISGVIPMDGVERLRCDMALKLGKKFIDYLNSSIEISAVQWETEVLPAITERHVELSALEHVKNTFEQSKQGSSATIEEHLKLHEEQGAIPFEKSVSFPTVANSSDSFFQKVPAAWVAAPELVSQSVAQQFLELSEGADEDIGKSNRI